MSRRLVLVVVAATLWIGGIAARLVALQVVDHETYRSRAARQQQRVVELDPARGTIYDARGRELAVSVEVQSAWADPGAVVDPAAAAAALAPLLGEPLAELRAVLASDRDFVWLARKLDPPVARAVAELGLAGVHFQAESKRYYPNRQLAAAALGYVGTDNVGLGGLEDYYDEVVRGQAGRRTLLSDARRGIAMSPGLAFAEPRPGHDLLLTLDASVQHVAERELARAVEERAARGGTAVVLDPWSGAVLAMASYPTFDPNRFAEYDESRLRNPAVQDAYEPGSTFKMITATAALAANLVDPSDVFDCEMGAITFGDTVIRDHKRFGLLTFREVIAKSSNVGAIKTGLKLGDERLYRAVRAFGFGERTGVDLPGESAGIVHPLEDWWRLSAAYVAFGHEMSLTALQLASAFAAVANGGTLYQPFVVAAQRTPGGEVTERREPRVIGRPLSESTAREVERLLEGVIAEGGTGTAAAVAGYSVAGKTGTAQKPARAGGYLAGRYVASFAGFAPARHPVLVAVVVIDEPRPPYYHGGQVAAPAFSAMAEQILLYLEVPPERQPPSPWPGEVVPDRRLATGPLAPGPEVTG